MEVVDLSIDVEALVRMALPVHICNALHSRVPGIVNAVRSELLRMIKISATLDPSTPAVVDRAMLEKLVDLTHLCAAQDLAECVELGTVEYSYDLIKDFRPNAAVTFINIVVHRTLLRITYIHPKTNEMLCGSWDAWDEEIVQLPMEIELNTDVRIRKYRGITWRDLMEMVYIVSDADVEWIDFVGADLDDTWEEYEKYSYGVMGIDIF